MKVWNYLRQLSRDIGLYLVAASVVLSVVEVEGVTTTKLTLLLLAGVGLWLFGLLTEDK